MTDDYEFDRVFPPGSVPASDRELADIMADAHLRGLGRPMPGEIHYAIAITGMMLCEDTWDRVDEEQRAEWSAAITAYRNGARLEAL